MPFFFSSTTRHSISLYLSSDSLTAPPSLQASGVFSFFFLSHPSLLCSNFFFKCAHHCLLPCQEGWYSAFAPVLAASSRAMMKKFVTIVLRGLVSLSKESPIWAKEHHHAPKKEIGRKRRAAKRAKTLGRRSLVRAVGISPAVSRLDQCLYSLRSYVMVRSTALGACEAACVVPVLLAG